MQANMLITLIHSIANLILIAFFLWKARKDMIRAVSKDGMKTWLLLLLILMTAVIARINYPTHHFMYVDDWYPLQMAKEMVHGHLGGDHLLVFISNALLYVPSYFIFGISDNVAVNTALFLSIASIGMFYLLVKLITGSVWPALLSAAILSFSPFHMSWSSSTYTQMPSFLFLTIALCLFLMHLKYKNINCLYASLASLLYLFNLRPEMILAAIPLFVIYMYKKRVTLKALAPWICFAIGASLLIPRNLTFFNILSTSEVISMGIHYVIPNILNIANSLDLQYIALLQNAAVSGYSIFILDMTYMPMIKISLVGLIFLMRKRKKEAIIFLTVGIILLSVNLVLSPEDSYPKKYMIPQSIIFLLFSSGLWFIISKIYNGKKREGAMLSLLLLAIFLLFLRDTLFTSTMKEDPNINARVFNSKLGGALYQRFPECTIVSPYPEVYSATSNINAINLLEYSYTGGCHIFVEDEVAMQYPPAAVASLELKRTHQLIPVGYITSNDIQIPSKKMKINYTIFRITGSLEQGTDYP